MYQMETFFNLTTQVGLVVLYAAKTQQHRRERYKMRDKVMNEGNVEMRYFIVPAI